MESGQLKLIRERDGSGKAGTSVAFYLGSRIKELTNAHLLTTVR